MGYTWDWGLFRHSAPDSGGSVLDALLAGLQWTLGVTGAAWAVALCVGALVGALCLSRNAGPMLLGRAYAGLFGHIPLVIQLLGWFVALPALLATATAEWLRQQPDAAFYGAALCLGLNGAVRVAGHIRTAFRSISPGQAAASVALGMRPTQTTWSVIAPQAIRAMLPGFVAEAATLFRETTLILVVATLGLLGTASTLAARTGHPVELYLAAAALYFAVSLGAASLVAALRRAVALSPPSRSGEPR